MKGKNLKEKPDKRQKPKGYKYVAKEKFNKLRLYNIRGEIIGELSPGGKVDFNVLLNRDRYKKSFKRKW